MIPRIGVCLWFTGRSGAGKSTVTKALLPLLHQQGRSVTVLDVVPFLAKQWFERSSEGKLIRKAFVASEIVRHRGIAICVTVSARRRTRELVREIIGEDSFVEVYVDSPANICLERKKRRNRQPSATKRAIAFGRHALSMLPFRRSGSYQPPVSPEVVIDSHNQSPEEGAVAIVQYLSKRGFLDADEPPDGKNSNPEGASRERGSGLAHDRALSIGC